MRSEDRDELAGSSIETSGRSCGEKEEGQSQAHEQAAARYHLDAVALKLTSRAPLSLTHGGAGPGLLA